MTIATDLFVRLLAMDSYFRGTGAPNILDSMSSGIGSADFLEKVLPPDGAPAEGFYAAAYEINGVTVISYRGTDSTGELVLTDFNIAQGTWEDDSALYAMQFCNAVDAATDNPILLTGHSLGGGLAGFVA